MPRAGLGARSVGGGGRVGQRTGSVTVGQRQETKCAPSRSRLCARKCAKLATVWQPGVVMDGSAEAGFIDPSDAG